VSSPTPTKLPATTATAASTTTAVYDDTNAGFVYSSGWEQVSDPLAFGGEFKRTLTVGSNVTFTFSGQKFSLIYKTGPLFGKVDIYVDGTRVYTLNQYTSAALYQQKWSYGGTLAAGTHTLKFVYVSGPTDGRVSVDAVSVP
jgi:hypothetical protein